MTALPVKTEAEEGRAGLIAGITAYSIWGLFPIYFVMTKHVPTLEILAHRIVWSVPFGLMILLFRKQIAETLRAVATPRTVILLTISASAMVANWGVYIWAIQNGQIFQGSLGYYINPLIYVLVGVVFFKETLSRWQALAILSACIGVAILTLKGGVFPTISLFLAVSFTIYGVLRKQIVVGAMPGLFIETIVMIVPAFVLLIVLNAQTGLAWQSEGLRTDALLVFAGPLTVLPLLAFAFAARRIRLSTLGILQFIGPTLQFACGVYYGEPFTPAHGWCFGFIWTGVALFAVDAYRKSRAVKRQAVAPR